MGHGTEPGSAIERPATEALGTTFPLTDHTFEAFGFAEPISRALTQREYNTPTPIQVQGLPPQLEGRDIMALAETGSGKTAAFLLPILQRYAANPAELAWKQVGALILAPTRELALQIEAEVASLARNMNIRRAVVLGGVSKGPQINALKRGVHILVATPGRLLDHVNMRSCDLSGVQTLVLDEADRMFDMGFIRDIKKIASMIPHKRRTAMFSATMPAEIRGLAKELLTEPVFIDLQPKTMVVDRIDQKVMIVRTPEKQSRLHTILADPACTRVIVFTRTKRGADRVTERLAMAGIGAIAIHGNKAQNARQRALADFTQGHVRVLVATDIAARGIDVSDVSHVINFELPMDSETYIHRIGRTARKGLSGIAISLCDPSERPEIKAIERLMKQTIEVIGDVGGEVLPVPEKRPHHAHDAPRREGAHRKGPSARSPAGEGHRKGGVRKPEGETRDSFRKEARPDRGERGDRGPGRDADRSPARSFEPRSEAVSSFDPINTVRSPDRAPRPDFKRAEFKAPAPTRPDAKRPDSKRYEDRRPEGPREGRADGDRKFQSRGPRSSGDRNGDRPERRAGERAPYNVRNEAPRPERSSSERPGPDRSSNDRPRSNFKRRDDDQRPFTPRPERSHAGPRLDGPRPDGPRSEGPRNEGKRFDRPQRSAGASTGNSEHRRPDGPRSDRSHSERPNTDRSHSERSHSGKPHAADRPHRAGKPSGDRGGERKGSGQQDWNGQRPPKFLKQREGNRDGAPRGDRPNPKPAA